MKNIQYEVSKELYDSYLMMSYSDRDRIIRQNLPNDLLMGYGYYGHTIYKNDGKHYIAYKIGGSCD